MQLFENSKDFYLAVFLKVYMTLHILYLQIKYKYILFFILMQSLFMSVNQYAERYILCAFQIKLFCL